MEDEVVADIAPDVGIVPASAGAVVDVPVEGEEAPLTSETPVWKNADAAMQVNLDANNDTLTQNAQEQAPTIQHDMAERAKDPNGENSEEAKEARKAGFLQEMQEQAEANKKWREEEHDFAGMMMSGNDIDKLIHFYASNPQMLDKLQERMVAGGKDQHKAKEAVEAFKDYMKLVEKQSKGEKLSPQEQQRMIELSKREDVREVAQQAVRVAQERGVKLDSQMEIEQVKILTIALDDKEQKAEIRREIVLAQAESYSLKNVEEDEDGIVLESETPKIVTASAVVQPVAFVSSSARDNFPSAPALMKNFEASSAMPVNDPVRTASLDTTIGMGNNDDVAIVHAALARNMPLAMGARA